MKKYNKLIIAALAATGMMSGTIAFAAQQDDASITAGQTLWKQLGAKEIQCSQLTDTNYENLGDYFMQQMMGSSHEAMDQNIIARYGQPGLDQMHIAMGKRFSDCDPNATYPFGMMGYGIMPMMGYGGMMGGYGYNNSSSGDWSAPYQNQNHPMFNMMGYGYGPAGYGYMGTWGWIFMVVFWALIIAGLVALVRGGFSSGSGRHHRGGNSALDILKERYAKGEIERKEFEEKKKDLE